jgi:translation initiation factor IF-2
MRHASGTTASSLACRARWPPRRWACGGRGRGKPAHTKAAAAMAGGQGRGALSARQPSAWQRAPTVRGHRRGTAWASSVAHAGVPGRPCGGTAPRRGRGPRSTRGQRATRSSGPGPVARVCPRGCPIQARREPWSRGAPQPRPCAKTDVPGTGHGGKSHGSRGVSCGWSRLLAPAAGPCCSSPTNAWRRSGRYQPPPGGLPHGARRGGGAGGGAGAAAARSRASLAAPPGAGPGRCAGEAGLPGAPRQA